MILGLKLGNIIQMIVCICGLCSEQWKNIINMQLYYFAVDYKGYEPSNHISDCLLSLT